MDKQLILVLGPTAVGKTDYAIELARKYSSPVISCDSRQIFTEMRIGTAPPSEDQLRQVRHYFIFSNSVSEYYSAGRYEVEAMALLTRLFKEHDRLVMAGGSGLYADALCYGLDDFPPADQELRKKLTDRALNEGLEVLARELKEADPESWASIDLSNRQRVVRALEVTLSTGRKFSSFKSSPRKPRPFGIERLCLTLPREELYRRINMRTEKMFEAGLVDEVRSLAPYRNAGPPYRRLPRGIRISRRAHIPRRDDSAGPAQYPALCKTADYMVRAGREKNIPII